MGDYNDHSHLESEKVSIQYSYPHKEGGTYGPTEEQKEEQEARNRHSFAQNMLYYALSEEANLNALENIVETYANDSSLEDKVVTFGQDLILRDECLTPGMKNDILSELTVELILAGLSSKKRDNIEKKRGPQRGEGADGIFTEEVSNIISNLLKDDVIQKEDIENKGNEEQEGIGELDLSTIPFTEGLQLVKLGDGGALDNYPGQLIPVLDLEPIYEGRIHKIQLEDGTFIESSVAQEHIPIILPQEGLPEGTDWMGWLTFAAEVAIGLSLIHI